MNWVHSYSPDHLDAECVQVGSLALTGMPQRCRMLSPSGDLVLRCHVAQVFRVSHATFMHLVDLLQPFIAKQGTMTRHGIPVEKLVAIALHRLATGASYRAISHQLGVRKSAVKSACNTVLYVLAREIGPSLIVIPSGDEQWGNMEKFRVEKKFPGCIGAVDSTHIPIKAPHHNTVDYRNRRGFHSIVLQAAVDFEGRFIDINVGFPGRAHDARVYSSSGLARVATGHFSLADMPVIVKDAAGKDWAVLPYLLGAPAYPLHPALIKSYGGSGSGADREWFNHMLSAARMPVDRAFGRLKGRWRILQAPIEASLGAATNTVGACCVLHNICEHLKEAYDDAWEQAVADLSVPRSRRLGQSESRALHAEFPKLRAKHRHALSGKQVRDILCGHVSGYRPEGWEAPGSL